METDTLKKLFWDVNEKSLHTLSEKSIIIRTLSIGTLSDIQSIFSLYGKEKIINIFQTIKKGTLSERRYKYFKCILS